MSVVELPIIPILDGVDYPPHSREDDWKQLIVEALPGEARVDQITVEFIEHDFQGETRPAVRATWDRDDT